MPLWAFTVMIVVCLVSFGAIIFAAIGIADELFPAPSVPPPKQPSTELRAIPGATQADVYWLNQHLELAGDTRTRYVQAAPARKD
ncbi:hypothetical protein BDK92_7139 [Micromonospora pisi]|uniref:Uncharacterized protein n=1 Tax=Micromonospora pisi TaxID=589240 RepID=A0A495JUK4_9ACTN|nr:hypothetical protein BDK92_7139 [Micromonospora pisi]